MGEKMWQVRRNLKRQPAFSPVDVQEVQTVCLSFLLRLLRLPCSVSVWISHWIWLRSESRCLLLVNTRVTSVRVMHRAAVLLAHTRQTLLTHTPRGAVYVARWHTNAQVCIDCDSSRWLAFLRRRWQTRDALTSEGMTRRYSLLEKGAGVWLR